LIFVEEFLLMTQIRIFGGADGQCDESE